MYICIAYTLNLVRIISLNWLAFNIYDFKSCNYTFKYLGVYSYLGHDGGEEVEEGDKTDDEEESPQDPTGHSHIILKQGKIILHYHKNMYGIGNSIITYGNIILKYGDIILKYGKIILQQGKIILQHCKVTSS